MQVSANQRASRGQGLDAEALAMLRAAWRCDCDGVSHRTTRHVPAGPRATVHRHLDVIESVTGYRPPTCPWRSFYDPLVSRAMELSVDADGGYIMATLGDDPPPLLIEALRIFRVARSAGERHVRKFLDQKNLPPTSPSSPSSPRATFQSMRRGRRRRG